MAADPIPDELTAALAAALAHTALEPCLMCGDTAHVVGVFSPYEAQPLLAGRRTPLLAVYGLCDYCFEHTTAEECEHRLGRAA